MRTRSKDVEHHIEVKALSEHFPTQAQKMTIGSFDIYRASVKSGYVVSKRCIRKEMNSVVRAFWCVGAIATSGKQAEKGKRGLVLF